MELNKGSCSYKNYIQSEIKSIYVSSIMCVRQTKICTNVETLLIDNNWDIQEHMTICTDKWRKKYM